MVSPHCWSSEKTIVVSINLIVFSCHGGSWVTKWILLGFLSCSKEKLMAKVQFLVWDSETPGLYLYIWGPFLFSLFCLPGLILEGNEIHNSDFSVDPFRVILVDCPTSWSLWYGYLDFYVDHLFRYPDDLRNIVQQCATSTHDRVHRAFAGDEEGWGGAEDEAVSTFGRSTWYDRQLGKQFLDTYVYKKVAGPHIAIGGRWWGKCSQWRLGPARHLLGEMLSLNNWTSWLCFRNWKGMNTNSMTLWSSTPTWTSSVLATLGPTMQGERVDT